MSSATSIERVNPDPLPDSRREASAAARDQLRPWHFFVLVSLLAATIAVVMAREARPEHLVLISLMIGAAGFAASALYRALVPLVSPAAAMQAAVPLSETRRAALEREKMLALRAIKELEFDRAMGKLSPKDFDEMAGRLRARAISLIRELDEGGTGYRELIERELNARLTMRVRDGQPRGAHPGPEDAPTRTIAADAGSPVHGSATSRTCACATVNDPDAAFCKRCGARLAADGGGA